MAKRIGVFVCECGPNIAEGLDVDAVVEDASGMDDVVVAAKHKLMCSAEGKAFLEGNIKELGLTHVVVAACSPKEHEATFMAVCESTGLNPYMFQLANIREQVVWVTKDRGEATEKAKRVVRAAVRRVRHHDPLVRKRIPATADVMVVGGGVSGMAASLRLASQGRTVHLVEREAELGGRVAGYDRVFPTMASGASLVSDLAMRVREDDRIVVHAGTEVENVLGFFGNFEVDLSTIVAEGEGQRTTAQLSVGAVVLATGSDLMGDLSAHGHGRLGGVVSAAELEQMNRQGAITTGAGTAPGSVAILHCVGRDTVGYCSEVCCMCSLKFARYIKDRIPGAKVHHIYRDLCVPGKEAQAFLEETRESTGAGLVRADRVAVEAAKGGLRVRHAVEGGDESHLDVDMVVLVPAMVPRPTTARLAEMLRLKPDGTGFLQEAHAKLDPVSTSIEGVYIVGCAQGPRSISDSVIQAEAAAGRVLSSLVPGEMIEPEARVSMIKESLCTGCQTCLTVCCYGAISYDPLKHVSTVNEVICRGCGNCVAACPSSAISLSHFTQRQLYQEIREAVR
jgi:heterodisulfide reductase subunit A